MVLIRILRLNEFYEKKLFLKPSIKDGERSFKEDKKYKSSTAGRIIVKGLYIRDPL